MSMNAVTIQQPLLDDTAQRLAYKLAIALGATDARMNDTIHRIWWRIATVLGADKPSLIDSTQRLLFKIASVLGVADARHDDMEQRLLWKIAVHYGSTSGCCAGVHDNIQRLLWAISRVLYAIPPVPPVLPNKPISPDPANGAPAVDPAAVTISWADGGGATSYDVWFNGVFQGNQVGTSFLVGALAGSTGYTWRIDAVNAAGTTTGDTWSFTTAAVGPVPLVVWEPATEVGAWTDAGGPAVGDYATFLLNADLTTLTDLSLAGTAITSLTANDCPALATIDCNTCTGPLVTLDVTGCTALTNLNCSINGSLTAIAGIGTCAALQTLDCNSCDVTGTLNLGGLANLTTVNCQTNANLTTLNVGGCTSLIQLTAPYCGITAITLANCTSLTDLDISYNALVNLDVTMCSSLVNLFGYGGIMASLNVSGLNALELVSCQRNSLTAANLTGCTSMTQINLAYNSLLSIDISTCTALTSIDFHYNSLNSTEVDGVLCDADASGQINGVLDVRYNSTPSVAGVTCATNLTGKGWSINYDP